MTKASQVYITQVLETQGKVEHNGTSLSKTKQNVAICEMSRPQQSAKTAIYKCLS